MNARFGRDRAIAWNRHDLELGQTLSDAVFDEHGVLLLPAGSRITEKFLHRVRFRDIQIGSAARRGSIVAGAGDDIVLPPTRDFETPTTLQLDKLIAEVGPAASAGDAPSVNIPRVELPRLRELVLASTNCYHDAVDQYADVASDIQRGRQLHLAASGVLLNQLLGSLQKDQSLAMLLMDMEGLQSEYLFQHGMNVSLLTMRVAAHMGFNRNMVMEAGMAALFQDIGMLSVPKSIRMAPRALTEAEKQEVQRHPIYTVERLARSGALRPVGLLIAYQAHERCDESGYPRHRAGESIHPLAQVVAAADMYCALTGKRPHRRSHSPFAAASMLLDEVKAGRLERQIIRKFLECVSLFPVGSYVRIGESQIARVLRANTSHLAQPAVVPVNDDGTETDQELDLARPGAPRITAALHGDDLPFSR